jgi:DNA invertase Pin-like site-specific DNA recombinase
MAASSSADKVGYARVSALDQQLDARLDALNRVGCVKIFSERLCVYNAVCA